MTRIKLEEAASLGNLREELVVELLISSWLRMSVKTMSRTRIC
jgi:hypothetical protein